MRFYVDLNQDAVENGIDPKDIHVVGHSMGCQMSSFIAKGLPWNGHSCYNEHPLIYF